MNWTVRNKELHPPRTPKLLREAYYWVCAGQATRKTSPPPPNFAEKLTTGFAPARQQNNNY